MNQLQLTEKESEAIEILTRVRNMCKSGSKGNEDILALEELAFYLLGLDYESGYDYEFYLICFLYEDRTLAEFIQSARECKQRNLEEKERALTI